MISLPPLNTRPGIEKERIELLNYCGKVGLFLEQLEPQSLEYSMPFFEYNAMRAAGISNLYPFWRKGDLAIFRKNPAVIPSRPELEMNTNNEWCELEIDEVRIRFILHQHDNIKSTPKVNHLISGDILPSVSSRDKRRKNANLWTSGNRIFQVEGIQQFYNEVKAYKNTQNGIDNETAAFIKHLVSLENNEFNAYLEWMYYEMERQAY